MESNNYHEEVVDEENKGVGVGRWYECIFCKRGFNTAQALGGHMNIHRKHSARNKPNSAIKQQQQHNPRSRHQPHFTDPTCFPSSNREHPPQPSNDWRMRFSAVGDVEINNRQASNQDKELDLELRLGYHS